MIRLILGFPPSANGYLKRGRHGVFKTKQAISYQRAVRFHALAAGARPFRGDVRVQLVVYRPRKVGDLDNVLKVLLDALEGATYLDDEQIVELSAVRRDDADEPRVEVTVEEVVTAHHNGGFTRDLDELMAAR
jgi:Holliday junction resolvase RusA-like endonuclease